MAITTSRDLVWTAAADLSAKQYFIVEGTTTGVNLCGDGEIALGVLQNAPASGAAANVQSIGMTKVICGGTLTVGAAVASDTDGKCVDAASGDFIIGFCVDSAGSGETASIYLHANGRKA